MFGRFVRGYDAQPNPNSYNPLNRSDLMSDGSIFVPPGSVDFGARLRRLILPWSWPIVGSRVDGPYHFVQRKQVEMFRTRLRQWFVAQLLSFTHVSVNVQNPK